MNKTEIANVCGTLNALGFRNTATIIYAMWLKNLHEKVMRKIARLPEKVRAELDIVLEAPLVVV